MKRTIVAAALTLLAFGQIGGQQPGQPDPLFSLPEQSRVQIQAIFDSAKAAGLPTGLLVSKAMEGIVKHVQGPKVRDEVHKLFGDLKQSREALGPMDGAAIEAGADALYAQVLKPDQLAQFKNGANGRSPVIALTYLSDLIRYRGVARDEATAAFVKLWRDGAADDDFVGLWRRVDQDILSGVNPGTALQNRVREIPGRGRGETPGQPYAVL